jgi:hypothetical protein
MPTKKRMMILGKKVAIIGSRKFNNYAQLSEIASNYIIDEDDEVISGGAVGADSMAQRWAKENGFDIHIFYPKYKKYGSPATFIRNEKIVRRSDLVLAFYSKGRFQQGGTANSANWARKLGIELKEFEEE